MKLLIALSITFASLASALAFSADTCWKLNDAGYAYDASVSRRLQISTISVTAIDPHKPTGSPDNNGGSNLQAAFVVSDPLSGKELRLVEIVSVEDATNQGSIRVLTGSTASSGCEAAANWQVSAVLGPWSQDTAIQKLELQYRATGDTCHSDWYSAPTASYQKIACAK